MFVEQIGSGTDAGAFFQSMVGNEKKHADELAERRLKLYGTTPPRVKLDDLFDIEAPDVGATHRNMSEFKACQVALMQFYAFGIDDSVALAVVFHIVGTAPVVVIGLALVAHEGLTWGQLSKIGETREE